MVFSNNRGYDGNTDNLTLIISTPGSDPVAYEVLSPSGYHTNGSIDPTTKGLEFVSLTLNSSVVGNMTEKNVGIWVRATDPQKPLTVSGIYTDQHSADAFLALPTGPVTQTYTYIANSMLWSSETNITSTSALLIVSTQNNTDILIVRREHAGNSNSPQNSVKLRKSYKLTLDWLGTYQIESMWDLTGTTIVSDKPLSVFAGHECTDVPGGVNECNHLFEQIPPTSTWGRFFFLVPSDSTPKTSPLSYRIVSANPFTTVTTTCFSLKSSNHSFTCQSYIATVGSFEQLQMEPDNYCYVSADKPVLVMNYAYHGSSDNGDPYMMMIIPNEQFVVNTTTRFYAHDTFNNHITIVVYQQKPLSKNDIQLDDVDISSKTWTDLYCSEGYLCGYTLSMSIESGIHTLIHDQIPVAVYMYGIKGLQGYVLPATMALRSKL